MSIVLNHTKIKRLRPKEKMYRVIDGDGLYIEVKPNGGKYWRWRYRKADGKSTMASLGKWPEVDIETARIDRDLRKQQAEYGNTTFGEAARLWFAAQPYRSEKNAALVWRRVELYLLPKLGNRQIASIKPADVLPILKAIEAAGHLELARRVRTIASQVFRYGVVNLMCDTDPAGLLQGATRMPTIKHMPAITDEKGFGQLLRAIDAADSLITTVRCCLQVAPYVALRSGEIRNARPEHLDLKRKLWTLPAEQTKMKKDHLVPLHDSAITILRAALQFSDGQYIFAGQRKGRPISENSLNVALRSLGYSKDVMVFHGFRSSFSTLGREVLRFDNELIERQLAHVDKNSVRAAYDRSYRLEERASMMRRWGDYLDGLRGQKGLLSTTPGGT